MPILKCSGTGPADLDCSVNDAPLTCNRIAEGVLMCRDEDGNVQAIIGQNIQPSSPAPITETKDPSLESVFDELIKELYNNSKNGGSNIDTLRDAFEVIVELARTDPDLALERIEDIRSYGIEINSADTQMNCDLFAELITHIKDPNYSLDHANELAGQNKITIDPQDPLTGLNEKLYPVEIEDIFIKVINNGKGSSSEPPLFFQGAGEFDTLNSFVEKLLCPHDDPH